MRLLCCYNNSGLAWAFVALECLRSCRAIWQLLFCVSCRSPVTWCIDSWSCVSSVTGVMWNIRVFTASVCTDECPPHETREALTRRYDSFRHIRMFISSGHYVRCKLNVVVWGVFRATCYWKMLRVESCHSCVTAGVVVFVDCLMVQWEKS